MGIAIGVLIVGVVINQLTRSSSHSPTHGKEALGAPEDLGVPFGASPTQVVRRLGQPNVKQSGCWIYKVNGAKEINAVFGKWVDAVKYCFGEGPTGGKAVSHISSHMVAHTVGKKHYPAGWGGLVVIAAR